MLRDVAAKTEQEMPTEVFLLPEVNAWVAERGGLVGIGSRRVMGIGLPLMETLTVAQLCAVLAHEFGHYYGGDTSLGPWLYATHRRDDRRTHGHPRCQRGVRAVLAHGGRAGAREWLSPSPRRGVPRLFSPSRSSRCR